MRWQARRFRFNDQTPGIDGLRTTRDVLLRGPESFDDLDDDIQRYLKAMLATIRPSSDSKHLVLAGALQAAVESPTWRSLMRGVWSALNTLLPSDDLLFATGDDVAGAMLRIYFWLALLGFADSADLLAYVLATAGYREHLELDVRHRLLAMSRGWHAVAEHEHHLPPRPHVPSPANDGNMPVTTEQMSDFSVSRSLFASGYNRFIAEVHVMQADKLEERPRP